jgi:hypothetical protein
VTPLADLTLTCRPLVGIDDVEPPGVEIAGDPDDVRDGIPH